MEAGYRLLQIDKGSQLAGMAPLEGSAALRYSKRITHR
jgi:hypothetical protein